MYSFLILGLTFALKVQADQYNPSPASQPRPIPHVVPRPQASQPVVQATIPTASPVPLSRTLVSFSLEGDRWLDWVGSTSQNKYNFNLLSNLASLTGQPPNIRVGANSEDHTNIDNSIPYVSNVFPNPTTTVPYPEATKINVGTKYYTASKYLPKGTHMTWGVNFGQSNLTAAFLEAKAITAAFQNSEVKAADISLDFLEIGNEADLYKNNGFRNASTWTPTQYVKEWTSFATNVSTGVGMTQGNSPSFLIASFAGSNTGTNGFSAINVYNAGVLTSAPGKLISHLSQHRYSGSFCQGSGGLLADLMLKPTIRGNITVFSSEITATRSRGLKYILGETNSYACHGAPGVSDTAGAALWALDYVLQAAVNHIDEVYFHQGIGFKYNFYQPITLTRSIRDGSTLSQPLAPHIHPAYHAALIAGEAIGTTGQSSIVELSISDTRVAGYLIYENSKPVRAVLINSSAYFRGATSRVTLTVRIDGITSDPNALMTVKRLTIGSADDVNGVTWGGQTWETADGLKSGSQAVENVKVIGGVNITATEAVLLSFV